VTEQGDRRAPKVCVGIAKPSEGIPERVQRLDNLSGSESKLCGWS
jgi:hypothetical protein